MKIPLFISWIFFVSSFAAADHAIYIGTIKIHHQEQDKHTTIDVKVFSDDLQNALKSKLQLTYLPDLLTLCSDSTNSLQTYFNQHLQLEINDQKVTSTLSDCQMVNDVHLLQFQIDSPVKWEKLKVTANFLMELFPTQSNVLQVQYEKNKSTKAASYFGRMTIGKETLVLDF